MRCPEKNINFRGTNPAFCASGSENIGPGRQIRPDDEITLPGGTRMVADILAYFFAIKY
jgi:hypothetical protein